MHAQAATMSMRHTLKSKAIEVIDIIPPGVDTELGTECRTDPDQSHGGMPLADFIDGVFQGHEHPREVMGTDRILSEAWGYEAVVTSRTVYVRVAWLRKKLRTAQCPEGHISTIRGIGYVFEPLGWQTESRLHSVGLPCRALFVHSVAGVRMSRQSNLEVLAERPQGYVVIQPGRELPIDAWRWAQSPGNLAIFPRYS